MDGMHQFEGIQGITFDRDNRVSNPFRKVFQQFGGVAAFHDMNRLARQVDGRTQQLVLNLIIRRHGAPTFRQTLHKDALLRKNRIRQEILFPQLFGQDFTRRNHVHLARIEQAVT